MFFGNPNKFAMMFDRVDCWNRKNCGENNGCFSLCIDGTFYPDMAENSVLWSCLTTIKEALIKIPENVELYNMGAEEAFKKLYIIVYPDDINIDNDYRYLMTPVELEDRGISVFGVRNKGKMRILVSQMDYDFELGTHIFDDITIHEVELTQDEIDELMKDIDIAIYELEKND